MRAITIRQPWAWAIMHAGKRIENRSRKDGRVPPMCLHRGELWIHAACHNTGVYWDRAVSWMRTRGLVSHNVQPYEPLYGTDRAPWGAIVGRVDVVEYISPGLCARMSREQEDAILARQLIDRGISGVDLRWWDGNSYGLVFVNAQRLVDPIPYRRGQQQLWTIPGHIAEVLQSAELEAA